jgi:catechol-2,3-dioxygenase
VSVVRLRHAALRVSDLVAAEKFFSEIFGMRVTERYADLVLMTADPSSSHELALQAEPSGSRGLGALDHLAFGVNSPAEVIAFGDQLAAKGINFSRSASGNRLYFTGFEGIGFEVCYDPAVSIADLVP